VAHLNVQSAYKNRINRISIFPQGVPALKLIWKNFYL